MASSQTAPTLPERLLRVDEVGAILGIDPRTVKRLARDGRLRRVVLGHRTTRYRESEVLTLIEQSTVPLNELEPPARRLETKADDVAVHYSA